MSDTLTDRWWETTCRCIKKLKNKKNPNALIFMCVGIDTWVKDGSESKDLLPQTPQECPDAVRALIVAFEDLREWNNQAFVQDPLEESDDIISDDQINLATVVARALLRLHAIVQQMQ